MGCFDKWGLTLLGLMMSGASASAAAPTSPKLEAPIRHYSSAAQRSSFPDAVALKHFLQRELYESDLDMKAVRYGWARVPGYPLAVVNYWSPEFCGTGGCHVMVLQRKGAGFRIVGDIGIARAPITVLQIRHHGLPDIGIVCRDTAMVPLWRVAMQFDGHKYPDTCFMPGARRVGWHAGKVILTDESSNNRLFE